MSQFFATNPMSRPPSGPKEGTWRRDLPADWREALGLAEKPEAEEPAAEAAAEPAPADAA